MAKYKLLKDLTVGEDVTTVRTIKKDTIIEGKLTGENRISYALSPSYNVEIALTDLELIPETQPEVSAFNKAKTCLTTFWNARTTAQQGGLVFLGGVAMFLVVGAFIPSKKK